MTRASRVACALVTLAVVIAFVVTPQISRAQPTTDADTLKRDADAAMDAGRPAEALAGYERAHQLAPERVELVYNIGRARLAIGDFAGALDYFEQFSREASEELKKKTHRLGEVIAELRGKVATLEVIEDSDAHRAMVSLSGRKLGLMPLHSRVNAGHAELRVELEGFEPYVKTIELAPGQTLVVQPVFVRVAPPPLVVTRLGIVASPAGATVLVDGERRGVTPIDLDVDAGTHRVVVSAPKHETRAVTVTLSRGETRRIDLQLREESPPVTSRWWFWTGVGVVAAGITTAVIAATVERSPSEGSLGTFRGP